MTFSMTLPATKSKQKPLAPPKAPTTKQYGLILPKRDSKKKEFSKSFNVFADVAEKSNRANLKDSKQDARHQVGTEAARSVPPSKVEKLRAQALAEDATVFDYDSVYDEMKSTRDSEAGKRAVKREEEKKKPKYISTLLQQAKIREVENERIRERRLLHERKADDALYGDKEKLISASYKRKLQEMQRWDAEDARLDALEKREDVTIKGENAMAGFYANLNKNIAMGGSTDNAQSAYTAKEAPNDVATRKKSDQPENGHDFKRHHDIGTTSTDRLCVEPATKKTRESEQMRQQVDLPQETLFAHEISNANLDASATQQESSRNTNLNKEDAIDAARARFLARKAQRMKP
ncbi:Uncharacterized conserved protein [Plasmopara halstedii]|uniref:Uncharacterized conserved protein n=1 Tax=Plasmopara halstedii TaxID=4781 RepID=A0A0P1B3B1_PLAHL|nr:Uncharacterized conserved protein [Plasmopara halstedii]CEG48588.1 Uncharacterized conserved protein [Plasmopara halstedii]|eukprot:XP_024584957.1 Uncharacterized conserved protein [Plasmopara halstedii]